MNPILKKQNEPELINLLKASTVAYTKAKKGETVFTNCLVFLAFAYPVSYVLIGDDRVKIALFGASFLITVFVQIFTDTFKGNTSKGALLKEEYDTTLFNLPWKSTLKKPDHAEVSRLSLLYKGKEIKDWYSPNLSQSIPAPFSIAILQHSNTSWDIGLREIFRNWLIGFLISYTIILWVFLLYFADGETIFLVNFSILSFYSHFISLIRGHQSVINKRKAISSHLDEMIRNKAYIGVSELRDIQDEIYITRLEAAKVPNFVFRLYKKRLNAYTEDYVKMVNGIFHSIE